MILHPERVEADIEKAATALRAVLHARKLDGWSNQEDDPLASFRAVTTKERFEQMRGLPQELPNKDALLRWQACLTIERVTWDDREFAETARHRHEHRIAELGDAKHAWSIQSLLIELLRSRDATKRSKIAHWITRTSGDASLRAIQWAMRRRAAAHHLGIGALDWLEVPVSGVSLAGVAIHVLDGTDEIANASIGESKSWENAIWLGAATEAHQGWPTALGPRWFRSVFGGWKTLDSLRIDPGPLCSAVCGSSFVRALARFGAALYRASAGRACNSFSVVHRPFDLASASYGALFASLLASVPFHKKHLGLGTAAAFEQAQLLGRAMLISVRVFGAQAAVSAAESMEAVLEAHASCASRALAHTVPNETAAVLPRYDPRAAVRLCGALRAAALQHELVRCFDDDWFDNPHAHEFLASIDVRERMVLDEKGVQLGVQLAKQSLSDLLLR